MHRQNHRKTFWIFGVLALAFCASMTALLLRREFGGGRSDLVIDANLRLDEPIETWLGFYAGEPLPGNRVGVAHLRQIPESRDGAEGSRTALDLDLQLELFERPADLQLEGWSWAPWRGGRLDFDFAVRTVGTEFAARGQVEGGRLRGEVINAGETQPLDLALPDGAALQPTLAPAMQFPVLEVGQSIDLPTFDPISLGPGRARVQALRQQVVDIAGERTQVRVYRVRTSGFDTEAWVDDRGDIVRATTPLGLTIARLPGPPDDETGGALQDSALLRETAVFPTGEAVRRGAQRIVWNLSLPPLPTDRKPVAMASEPTDDSNSSNEDGESELDNDRPIEPPDDAFQRIAPADTAGASVSGSAATARSNSTTVVLTSSAQSEFADRLPETSDLAADLFVQSDHPRIRAAAAEIFSGLDTTASPAQQAAHLHQWVYENLDKVPVLGVPSALEVLEARRGDCNEHAILYTALARAHGLPTRIAAGLVWSTDLEGLYYHAWPEVWTGDAWHRYDPTLGQERADATHIKLLEGGVERWPALLAFLGRIELEAVSVE